MVKPPFFQHYCKVLKMAKSQLFAIPWDSYGEQLRLIDQTQGMVLGYRTEEKMVYGEFGSIPDSRKSRQVLNAKFEVLSASYAALSSLEGRDPDRGIWGGAVRCMGGAQVGLIGLPEIGDHITVVKLVSSGGGVNSAIAGPVLEQEQYHALVPVLEHAGMSDAKFKALCEHIGDILTESICSVRAQCL